MRRLDPTVLACAAVAVVACGWNPVGDARTQRCLEALRYRLDGDPVRVIAVDLDPRSRSVSIRFDSDASPLERRITCRHEPGDRWTLESVRIGDESLSDAAMALVNAELLLRDLADRERLDARRRDLPPSRPAHAHGESG